MARPGPRADLEHDVDFFRTSRCRYMLTLIIGMLRESLTMFGACRRIGTDAPRPVMTMGFALRIYYSKNLDSVMIYAIANSVSPRAELDVISKLTLSHPPIVHHLACESLAFIEYRPELRS